MSAGNVGDSWRDSLSRITLNSWLGASLAALVVGAVVVLAGITAIGTAAFGPGIGRVQPDQELKTLLAEHDEKLQTWQDRLNGRSPFFKPAAPPPPPPKDPPRDAPIDPPPPPPQTGPPVRYEGPPIAFAFGDEVYFNSTTQGDGKVIRVRVGEEQSGLRVISMSMPWSVKVGHKGGEYDVPLFNRSDESAFVKSGSRPVIFQESFIVAVNPQPEIIVPPATGSEPTVTQAAAMSGETAVPPNRREQPRRAMPQPNRGQPATDQRPARGAPPENAPPEPEEEQPIEEDGVDESAENDEGEPEDPEANEEQETPSNAPPPAPPQSPQADNADTDAG